MLKPLTDNRLMHFCHPQSQESRLVILQKTTIGREILNRIEKLSSPTTLFFSTSSLQQNSTTTTPDNSADTKELIFDDNHKRLEF